MMIGPKSRNAPRHRRTGHPVKEEKIQNGSVGGAPVVLLVLRYVEADLLARSRCQHVFLLKIEPSPARNFIPHAPAFIGSPDLPSCLPTPQRTPPPRSPLHRAAPSRSVHPESSAAFQTRSWRKSCSRR